MTEIDCASFLFSHHFYVRDKQDIRSLAIGMHITWSKGLILAAIHGITIILRIDLKEEVG